MSTTTTDRDALTETIRRAVPLLWLVRDAVPEIRRAGAEWRGPCPIHGGDGPNLAVNPDRGLWHCHTCGAGGDVFEFARLARGLSFPDARAWLANIAGIPLDGTSPAHPQAYQIPSPRPRGSAPAGPGSGEPPATTWPPMVLVKNETAPNTPVTWSARTVADRVAAAAEWRRRTFEAGGTWREPSDVYTALRDALPLGPTARDYLTGRGIDPALAFQLGVRSVEDWSTFGAVLEEVGVDPWEGVTAGLHVASFYHLPNERTETRPARTSPAYVEHNLPALAFFYAGQDGEAVGVRLRTTASAEQLEAAGLTPPNRWRYLSLNGNAPRLPWGADALVNLHAGDVLHVTEGEPDALTLRAHGVRVIGMPGAQGIPGGPDAGWLRAAGRAQRILVWYDADRGGDEGAPRLARALQQANDWTDAEARWRVVRVRISTSTDAAKIDANALHQAGALERVLAAVLTATR